MTFDSIDKHYHKAIGLRKRQTPSNTSLYTRRCVFYKNIKIEKDSYVQTFLEHFFFLAEVS